jgi:hypothetical protein
MDCLVHLVQKELQVPLQLVLEQLVLQVQLVLLVLKELLHNQIFMHKLEYFMDTMI